VNWRLWWGTRWMIFVWSTRSWYIWNSTWHLSLNIWSISDLRQNIKISYSIGSFFPSFYLIITYYNIFI
jgi:hypothetical protein